ncbi:MAG TPA: DUF4261 domain-containing protein [Chthoniobacter sp.]|jgi:hypothetical protein
MAKGFFTQGSVILLKSAPKISEFREYLSGYKVLKEVEGTDEPWLGGPSLVLEYRREVNGFVAVDLVPARWPDHMGDSKQEPMLFGAWSMGHFGPYAYPFGLQRATEQKWRWEKAPDAVNAHTAFLRIRLSYIFGGNPKAVVMPKDCNPEHELQFLTQLTSALLRSPEAICYFNPNGEVLLPKAAVDYSLKHHTEKNVPPLELWSNIRLFNLDAQWLLMDSVGNWQLDTLDHEVAFPKGRFSPQDVDQFIRNITLYLRTNGDVIKDGNTADGPGNVHWQAKRLQKGLSDPPRAVLRWLPYGQEEIPEVLLKEQG